MLLLLLACNQPPTVTFSAPESGATVMEGTTVTFAAGLADDHDPPSALNLKWSAGNTLLEGEETLSGSTAELTVAGQLPLGDAEVSLTATDQRGSTGKGTIILHIVANTPPAIQFTSPEAGSVLPASVPTTISIQAVDPDESDLSILNLRWTGLEDAAPPEHPDPDGSLSIPFTPKVGDQSMSVTVSDPQAGFATAILQWTAIDADMDQDGFVDKGAGGNDCDDANATIHPNADEHCDGADEDCDGVADNDAVNAPLWYRDNDGDGWGAGTELASCTGPTGWVEKSGDCNDNDAGALPGALEICDGLDNDCDGLVPTDEGTDADGDGFVSCDDCADTLASVHRGAQEICDGANMDEDCDGYADDQDTSATGKSSFYRDADGDGYGVTTPTTSACDLPFGYAVASGDCDDVSAVAYPGNAEICGDGYDNDCDGIDPRCRPAGTTSLTAADRMFDGEAGNDLSGTTVSTADIDGDGASEVLIGAWGANSAAGALYVVSGSAASGSLSTALAEWTGVAASDSVGFSLAGVGDTNGDGNADVLVGAFGVDTVGTNGGAAYLLQSPATGGSLSTASATFSAEKAGDLVGISVGGPGDVNGDGYDDLLIGASNNDSGGANAGAAYLVLSPVVGAFKLANADAIYKGEAASSYTNAVSGAGDANGDGFADMLIGAYQAQSGGSSTGRAYLVYGPGSGSLSLSAADAVFSGESVDDYAGYNLASGGDVDGDGLDDFWIGAYQDDDAGSNAGAAYLILGPGSTRSLAAADAKLTGEDQDDRFGLGLSGGDVDQDGYSDVLIGAWYDDVSGMGGGSAYLLYGPLSGQIGMATADAHWLAESTRDNAGRGIAIADTDADGFGDLLIGASSCASGAGGAGSGRTYLIYGGGF